MERKNRDRFDKLWAIYINEFNQICLGAKIDLKNYLSEKPEH